MFDFSKLTGNWAMDTYNGTRDWVKSNSVIRETPFQTEVRFLESVPDSTGHRQPVLMSTDLANKDYPSNMTSSSSSGVAVPLFIPPNTQHAQFVPLIDQNQVASHITGLDQIVPVNQQSLLTHVGMFSHPQLIVDHIWTVFKSTFGYVIWSYEDFVIQFQAWDGSVGGLMHHVGLIWRTMITIVLTLGILELGPFIDGMSRIFMEIGELIAFTFRLVETTINEMWYFMNLLWQDLMVPFQWILNQTGL